MLLALLPGIKVGANFDLGHARTLNSSNIVLLFPGLKQLPTIFQHYYSNLLKFLMVIQKPLNFSCWTFLKVPNFQCFNNDCSKRVWFLQN